MEIDAWLQTAIADAERRGLPELAPFLAALARATETLRRVERDIVPKQESNAGGEPGGRAHD